MITYLQGTTYNTAKIGVISFFCAQTHRCNPLIGLLTRTWLG